MPSIFPDGFDSDLEIPRVDKNVSEISGDTINSLRDAIFAMQKSIGLSPQGNTSDLVTRINGVIDQNGQIKTTALASKGLITLPINNSHIDQNAGIAEAKLNLDFTTAVLNANTNSVLVDLNALRINFTAFVIQSVSHFGGVGDRHDGYNIDIVDSIRSSNDVESALHVINNAFTAHEQSISGQVHTASSISVNNEFVNISADEVQTALVELDALGTGKIDEASDTLHQTAVAKNQRGEEGTQGNLRLSTMAPTIFQTDTSKATNILQVMRPNTARVTSKNLDIRGVKAGETNILRIKADGIDRGFLDVDLTTALPIVDLNEIIQVINTKAQGGVDHYPISAYNTNGELTIAHNIPGNEFTIEIISNVALSAHAVLGFSEVADTPVSWSGVNHAGYAGGRRINDFKSLIKIRHNHTTTPLNTIVPGLGDLSKLGFNIGNEGRILCNITNHSTNSADNGTHYILSFPDNEKFILSADIALGKFDLEVAADAVNFQNSANGEIFDIFVKHNNDGYGVVTKSNRATFGPISGINIKALSENFPAGGSVAWEINSGSSVQLSVNNSDGIQVPIPTGFIGELRAYAPDNVNSATFIIDGAPASGTSIKRPITVSEFGGSDDHIYIGSVHYSGNFGEETLKFITDRRQLGASVDNTTSDPFMPVPLHGALQDLRNNGIVRGFNVLSSSGSSVQVQGGRAYVSGKSLDVETQEVFVSDFSVADHLLLLDEGGKFFIKSEFDGGFSFEELLEGDSHGDNRNAAIVAQIHTDGSSIDGYTDRRLFISNIDKRLSDTEVTLNQKIDEIKNIVSGTFWGITIAEANVAGDGYLASIESGVNFGFINIDEPGFSAGNNLITTRRFEFDDIDIIKTTIFRAIGLTHINVFVEVTYTGSTPGIFGPFGTSGTVNVDFGVAVEVGKDNITTTEEYATVKTIASSILPSNSVVERYVASIPVSQLNIASNVMFDVVPRVRITGSTFVDGGSGGPDPNPEIRFDHIRIVTSSYSIAGNILSEDGSSLALATTVGDVL